MSRRTQASSSASKEQPGKKRQLRKKEDENRPSKSSKSMKFNQIDDIFSYYTSLGEFCIGGKFELNEKASNFFYKSSDGSIQCIDFLNISEKEIDTLASNCSLAPFGMGTKTVVDASVRQAKELTAKSFSSQFNPMMTSSISSEIKKLLGGREFLIEPYKLNIYPKGGHFKRHKDTLKSDRMIASLVICLPIPFEGGMLTVENKKGKCVNFDWGKEISLSTAASKKIQWACFFCSCDHFISKVTKGNRIIIAYDIFTDGSKKNIGVEKKAISEGYHEDCGEHLQNFIKTLDVKTKYGYFPNHVYRFTDTNNFSDTDEEENSLRDKLKGNDLLLYDTLVQLGWKVALQVYYTDNKSYGPYVNFVQDDDCVWSLNDLIGDDDRKKLRKLRTLKLLNKRDRTQEEKIYDFKPAGDYYMGNEAPPDPQSFYACTIMVLRHRTKSESVDEYVEDTESSECSEEEIEEESDSS